tara:strand:- start:530 stop:1213 length:684 start_codon:yes stop_codon:yes gene_type:complete
MKKLLGIVVLGLLLSGNAYAANEGSGPIKFPPKFEQRFKAYLNYIKNEKNYSFAFAFHPNGANDFQAVNGKNKKKTLKVAQKKAIKACNKKAKKKGCMVFARNAQIVWNWDSIPTVYYTLIETAGAFDYINWKDVSPEVGKGPISLSKETTKNYKEYLTIYKNNKNEKNFYTIFALSPDGKVSGDMDGWGQKVSINQIEALAVAECMTNNKKEKCYIYAINNEIVWK